MCLPERGLAAVCTRAVSQRQRRQEHGLWTQITTVMSMFACRFKNDQEGFACGGSGTLFKTMDGGKTWQRDRSTDQIAGNLYAVKYTPSGTGFILGNDGILLRNFG